MSTHESLLPCGDPFDETVIGNAVSDNRSCSDERVSSDGQTTENGCVSADGGAATDQDLLCKVLATNASARIRDIGQDAAWPEKDFVFDSRAIINGDVILNFDAVPDSCPACYENGVPQSGVASDAGSSLHVTEMPYRGAGSDGRTFFDNCRGVCPIAGGYAAFGSRHLHHFVLSSGHPSQPARNGGRRIDLLELVGQFERWSGILRRETVSLEDLSVDFDVQIFPRIGELQFGAVNANAPVDCFLGASNPFRQARFVDREEPPHPSPLELEGASNRGLGAPVNVTFLCRAEDPKQHVQEMNSDAADQAAGTFLMAFPRGKIPRASRSDVGEIDLMDARSAVADLCFERAEIAVLAELQDGVYGLSGFGAELEQRVELIGAEDQGFFADRVAPRVQHALRVMGVKIVGRTDRDIIDRLSLVPELSEKVLEILEIQKELRSGRESIQDPYRVVRIHRTKKRAPELLHCFQMSGGDVASGSQQGKSDFACSMIHGSKVS